jgi:hypothetical protein
MMHLRNPDRQQAGSYTGPSASPTVNGYIAFVNAGDLAFNWPPESALGELKQVL